MTACPAGLLPRPTLDVDVGVGPAAGRRPVTNSPRIWGGGKGLQEFGAVEAQKQEMRRRIHLLPSLCHLSNDINVAGCDQKGHWQGLKLVNIR